VAEYAIILLTFMLINLFGLELGMACGVLVAMAHFIADYARAPVRAGVAVSGFRSSAFALLRAACLNTRS
jgi:MFS superfamily sulfate permease-like transporter